MLQKNSTLSFQLISYLKNEFSLNKGSKLLELGCGRGDFLHEFQNLGFDCYGVDREKSKFHDDYNLNVFECDLEKDDLPFDDNEFDPLSILLSKS